MNYQNVPQETLSQWLIDIKTATNLKNNGQFNIHDESGAMTIIDWHITDILSPNLAAFKKNIACNLATQVTTATEMQFLRQHPHAASEDSFLQAYAHLFANGIKNVNWDDVKNALERSIQQFYLMDISKFGAEIINKLINDIYYFASIKDQQTDKLLGFIVASVTPALPYGDIKVINVIIAPEEQNRGLEQILLSSIFKVIPHVKRIFTITRPTNSSTITAYQSCGFIEDLNPIQDPNHKINNKHFVVFEYNSKDSNILQKLADLFAD